MENPFLIYSVFCYWFLQTFCFSFIFLFFASIFILYCFVTCAYLTAQGNETFSGSFCFYDIVPFEHFACFCAEQMQLSSHHYQFDVFISGIVVAAPAKRRWPVQRLCEIVIASNVGRSEKNFLFCSQESVATVYIVQDMDLILSLNWKWMPRQRTENVLHLRTRNVLPNEWRGSDDGIGSGSGSGSGADNNNNAPIRRINEDERNGK